MKVFDACCFRAVRLRGIEGATRRLRYAGDALLVCVRASVGVVIRQVRSGLAEGSGSGVVVVSFDVVEVALFLVDLEGRVES